MPPDLFANVCPVVHMGLAVVYTDTLVNIFPIVKTDGLSGIFKSKGLIGQLSGITIAILLRLVCHFFSGVVIFASMGMLWEGFYTENSWIYSIIYNASYMLPELIFTLIGATALLKVPQTKKIILAE